MTATIVDAASAFNNVRVIAGLKLLPDEPGLLTDHVHPKNAGFKIVEARLHRLFTG